MSRGREGRQLLTYWLSGSPGLITLGPTTGRLKMEKQVSASLGLRDPDGFAHGRASLLAQARQDDHRLDSGSGHSALLLTHPGPQGEEVLCNQKNQIAGCPGGSVS